MIRLSAFAFSLLAVPCLAQETAPQDAILVPEGSAQGATGRIAINLAAGTGNQNLSAASISIGEVAASNVVGVQASDFDAPDRSTRIGIGNGAFAGISGLTSVNATAGSSNQAANLAAIAIGNSGTIGDLELAQVGAPIEPHEARAAPDGSLNDTIAIADDAFGDGSGLVQLNLVGGEGNASANTFVLSVSAPGGE